MDRQPVSPDASSGARRLRIALVANTCWYLYNFRRNLMTRLRLDGHEVLAVGGVDGYAEKLRQEGFACAAIPFSATGTSPLTELRTVRALRRTLRDRRVDVVLSYTPKGNIYGVMALAGTSTALIANISGLGRSFVQGGWFAHLVRILYGITLRHARNVFFQNEDDRQLFLRERLVTPIQARRVPGSGVDLRHFQPIDERVPDGSLRVLMIARLLWSKGIAEYVESARRLRSVGGRWQFALLGELDESQRSGVAPAMLRQWVDEGLIEYLGSTDDVRPFISAADCIVLPSYREGVPRSLLEAAAMARPVVATDVPGCRECIDDGVSGFLCKPQDAADLTRALNKLAALDHDSRREMGRAGRRKVESEFDERIVIERYLEVIRGVESQLARAAAA
jgi:glycosyltransferase involved in cell wall biosynthesis